MTLYIDPDFRSYLEAAVAYRMTERLGIDPEEARRRIRDFLQYGNNSHHSSEVLETGYELFRPILKTIMPFLRAATAQAVTVVEAQITRGQAAEQAVEK